MKSSVFFNAENRFGIDLIDLGSLSNVSVDLKYSGIDNFMKEDLYQGFKKAYLQQEAFKKFSLASQILKDKHPQLSFLILDALRPRHIQKKMHDFVKNTKYEHYVANPYPGSMHNFGMAIDLTLIDQNNNPLDMGTVFDDFTDLAQPQLEDLLLENGLLSLNQIFNRLILRQTMMQAGFWQLPHEWWHYNAFPSKQVLGHYQIIE